MTDDLDEMMSELRSFAQESLLTAEQVEIFEARRRGSSYAELEARSGVSGPTALKHCLLRTACGFPWWPGMTGGADPYLSPGDQQQFRDFIQAACDEVNCLTATVALSLAFDLAKVRASRARKLLLAVGCPKLAARVVDPCPPSRTWLNSVCDELEVRICRSQELEVARRLFCDFDVITAWFLQFAALLDRSPWLIFNMDETYVSAKRCLHCLVPRGLQPLVTAMPVVPHMTGAVTINAMGLPVKPLIIVPKKKTMKSLEMFTDSAFFGSSTTGWMTKALFRYYAMLFVSEVSFLRPRWPREVQEEPVLLLLDGHPSRWDFKANLIFYLFNVDVLSFAGHCSHLMQAFDVGIASPLKTALKQLLSAATFEQFLAEPTFESLSTARKRTMTEIRSLLIDCFISACQKTCTRSNCRSSFAATGIYPYCPSRVMESQYAMDPPRDGIFPRRSGKANAQFLTSEEALAAMFREENGRELTQEDMQLSIREIFEEMRSLGLDRGIPLTDAPDILLRMDRSQSFRLFNLTEL